MHPEVAAFFFTESMSKEQQDGIAYGWQIAMSKVVYDKLLEFQRESDRREKNDEQKILISG